MQLPPAMQYVALAVGLGVGVYQSDLGSTFASAPPPTIALTPVQTPGAAHAAPQGVRPTPVPARPAERAAAVASDSVSDDQAERIRAARERMAAGSAAYARPPAPPVRPAPQGEPSANVAMVRPNDAALEAARNRARASLDQFIAAHANPPAGARNFALKVKFIDGKAVEYMWVNGLKIDGDRFTGTLNNTPGLVHNVKAGEAVAFTRADVTDWMYVVDGEMKGNFGACVIIAMQPGEQRAQYARRFGLRCDG